MSARLKRIIVYTVIWLSFFWLALPSIFNRLFEPSSLIRLDPQFATDFNCIFIEGYGHPSFAVPWLVRSTPIQYLRIRYTPLGDHQPYGIMFVDPKTLAYEADAGFASTPTRLSGKLDSPSIIRDWMQSQPNSTKADNHKRDAQEIYDAILMLAQAKDLEHFTLPASMAHVSFQIGHTSLIKHQFRLWFSDIGTLIPIWLGFFAYKKSEKQKSDDTSSASPSTAPGRS